MSSVQPQATVRAAPVTDRAAAFRPALDGFDRNRPVLILSHNDADGLSAAAILSRAVEGAGRQSRIRIVGRGESPWSQALREEVQGARPGGLIVADLGIREGAVAPGVPTIIVDHHIPTGVPGDALVISGYGQDPVPTSSLIAYRCAGDLGPADDLVWLAALGIIGDMAEESGFAELEEARRRFGITNLRKAVSLLNAPRRAASGDAGPALALLLKSAGPKEVLSGVHPETADLLAARDEVKAELERGKRVGPVVRGDVALIRFDSPCQVHPLLAQTWRGRLPKLVVLAANAGFRPGWVHFAARTSRDFDLVAFLAEHAPAGVDENYGSGHRAASGGALRPAAWNDFIRGLGFGPEQEIA